MKTMSEPYYPRQCKKHGHNHVDRSTYIEDKMQPLHVTWCLHYGGIWPFRRRCEHIEEWTPDMKETPPITIFRDTSPVAPLKSHLDQHSPKLLLKIGCLTLLGTEIMMVRSKA